MKPPTRHAKRHVLVLLGFNEHDFLRGILAYAREASWTLDMNYNRIGVGPDPDARFDGILTVVGKQQEVNILRAYAGAPCVDLSGAWLFDLKDPAAKRVGRVIYDAEALGRMAAEHLLDRGFKNLAFLNTCNGWHERPSIRACAEAAAQANARFIEIHLYRELGIKPPYSITKRSPQMMRWLANALARLPKPCGVVVVDDWAPNLLRACDRAGLAVPEELAVVGLYNHRDACEYASIPISAVDADFERIAYQGSQLLDRLMRGARAPKKPLLVQPKGVVVRHSTDVLAVEHGEVAAALRFVWDHFREPIQAGDAVAATNMSYRGLSLAFQKHVGRTIGAEIGRKRVDEAQRLLRDTDLKASQIAKQSGFSGLEHLSRAFKRYVGQPPSVYRRAQRGRPQIAH
jgi:LacI family transcriptional regulator